MMALKILLITKVTLQLPMSVCPSVSLSVCLSQPPSQSLSQTPSSSPLTTFQHLDHQFSSFDVVDSYRKRAKTAVSLYSSGRKSLIFCFAQILRVNYQDQGQFWNLPVLRISAQGNTSNMAPKPTFRG